MKEVLYFIKWQLKRWTFFEVVWTLSCGFFGSGLMDMYLHPEQTGTPWQMIIGFCGVFAILIKISIIDGIRNNWHRYKQEKINLLSDIQGN